MDALTEFSLPIKGLGIGQKIYNFKLDNDFYRNFEASFIHSGQIDVELLFDKRHDMIVLEFNFQGIVQVNCDRCLEQINLPIKDNQALMVKYSEEDVAEEADIIYISPYETELNVARFIYEYTCLAVPMKRVYDCDNDKNAPCDDATLAYLNDMSEVEQETEKKENPIWDDLKNFNNN